MYLFHLFAVIFPDIQQAVDILFIQWALGILSVVLSD